MYTNLGIHEVPSLAFNILIIVSFSVTVHHIITVKTLPPLLRTSVQLQADMMKIRQNLSQKHSVSEWNSFYPMRFWQSLATLFRLIQYCAYIRREQHVGLVTNKRWFLWTDFVLGEAAILPRINSVITKAITPCELLSVQSCTTKIWLLMKFQMWNRQFRVHWTFLVDNLYFQWADTRPLKRYFKKELEIWSFPKIILLNFRILQSDFLSA